ncbi:hypothetical protein P879_11560 [Paragonimus westermani]|uniref:alpha-1,2-Mannosidase n=1 Tax=Paragonimus westermani TaxID=34504 RepID=A0A8T0D4B6_9TREM|nr:hypothetical protein P879_11560 [Paragonimus westermani]
MTKHAWQSYVAHAWGFNELKPVSRAGHQPSVLGTLPLGATIVDSMDTLYIMGLKDEFNKARSYVANELDFSGTLQSDRRPSPPWGCSLFERKVAIIAFMLRFLRGAALYNLVIPNFRG